MNISSEPTDFYFYSFTDRRCIIQREEREQHAWKLEYVGDAADQDGLYAKVTDPYETTRYIVTTAFGKEHDREKVESRELISLHSAISWASFVQSQNSKKTVSVWRIC